MLKCFAVVRIRAGSARTYRLCSKPRTSMVAASSNSTPQGQTCRYLRARIKGWQIVRLIWMSILKMWSRASREGTEGTQIINRMLTIRDQRYLDIFSNRTWLKCLEWEDRKLRGIKLVQGLMNIHLMEVPAYLNHPQIVMFTTKISLFNKLLLLLTKV